MILFAITWTIIPLKQYRKTSIVVFLLNAIEGKELTRFMEECKQLEAQYIEMTCTIIFQAESKKKHTLLKFLWLR